MRGPVCVPAHFWKAPCVNAQCPLVVFQPASLEFSQQGPFFHVISETICCAKQVSIGSRFAEDSFSEFKCYI